jgi:predicted RNase H-like HicB family nuclease
MRYLVIIERTRNGYSAYAPDLPGCIAAGKTRAGTIRLMEQAVELHIEDLRERGHRVPRPKSESHTVELQSA